MKLLKDDKIVLDTNVYGVVHGINADCVQFDWGDIKNLMSASDEQVSRLLEGLYLRLSVPNKS